MDCLYISPKKDEYGPIADALIKAAGRMGIAVEHEQKELDKYDYVVSFSNRPEHLPVTTAKLGWWMCDLRDTEILAHAPALEAIFLCNKLYLEDYEKRYRTKAYYMPQCGLDHEDVVGRKIDWDVVFIGRYSDTRYHINRYDIVRGIKDKFRVEEIMKDRYTPDTKWIYSQSPFSLSISMPYEGYTSNRTYNILASKGFCLINYFPGIEDLFENHKHLAWFKTYEEATAIINYYYENPDKYEAVKEAGYKLYQKKHTAEARLKNMFDILHGDFNQTNPFYGTK